MFFGTKGSKLGQNVRKTLQHSSSNTALPASGTTASIPMSTHGSMRIKARRMSSSIKSRFKNLFTNKSDDNATLPAQQVEAQRTHVSDFYEGSHFGPAICEGRGFHEGSSLSKVASHVPSLHAVPSSERLHSRRGSIDSLGSESRRVSDEKSRVTSWASTEANTVIARRPCEEDDWEKQRLSVITEHGYHAPSPSLTRPKLSLQTITSEEELAPPAILERLPPGSTVDSERVYSALMKRMSETQQRFTNILEQQRQASDSSDPFRTLSPPTSDDSSDSGGPAAFTHSHPPATRHQETSRSSSEVTKGSYRLGVEGHRPLSPPVQLNPRGADISASKPITDRSSAFFGSPTSHLFRTRSPWRRSLQDAMEKDGIPSPEPTVIAPESVATTNAIEMADKKADSASNYSQDTQIHKLEKKQEFPIVGICQSMDTREHDIAHKDTPTRRPTGERIISTASSVDWKTRLSYDVANMAQSPPSPTRVSGPPHEIEYVVPTMPRTFGHGHVREAAQIGVCEEDECKSTPAVRMPTSSTTPLGPIEPNVIKLTPQQRSVIQTTPPPVALLLREHNLPASRTAVSFREDNMSLILPQDAMRPRASPLDSSASCGKSSSDNVVEPQTPAPEARPIRQAKSLAHIQSIGRVRAEETGSPRPLGSPTVRLMRKAAAKLDLNSRSAASTLGFSTAFERQFGSLPRHLAAEVRAKENQSPHVEVTDGTDGRVESPLEDAQARGSKNMVDMFLNSRRQHRESGDGAAFV